MQVLILITENDVLNFANARQKFFGFVIATFSTKIAVIARRVGIFDIVDLGAENFLPNSLGDVEVAWQRAKSYDACVSRFRQQQLEISFPTVGWHIQNCYFLYYGAHRIATILRSTPRLLSGAKRILLFSSPGPAAYHVDSAFFRNVYVFSLRAAGFKVELIPVDSAFVPAPLFSLLIPNGIWKTLVHIPTVFYPSEKLRVLKLISETSDAASSVDLESPQWDVSVNFLARIRLSNSSGVLVQSDISRKIISQKYNENFAQLTIEEFLNFLPEVGLATKTTFLNDLLARELNQIGAYFTLRASDSLSSLDTIITSDHDGGLNGPVLTFGISRGARIIVVPHSGTQNLPLLSDEKIERENCPIGLDFFLDLCTEKSKKFPFTQTSVSTKKPFKRIILIVNEFFDPYGFNVVSPTHFSQALAFLIQYLIDKNWEVGIRLKPNRFTDGILMELPCRVVRCEGNLDDWVDWPALCCSLITPTSALLKFWQRGIACIHIQEHILTPMELAALPESNIQTVSGLRFIEAITKLIDENVFEW